MQLIPAITMQKVRDFRRLMQIAARNFAAASASVTKNNPIPTPSIIQPIRAGACAPMFVVTSGRRDKTPTTIMPATTYNKLKIEVIRVPAAETMYPSESSFKCSSSITLCRSNSAAIQKSPTPQNPSALLAAAYHSNPAVFALLARYQTSAPA